MPASGGGGVFYITEANVDSQISFEHDGKLPDTLLHKQPNAWGLACCTSVHSVVAGMVSIKRPQQPQVCGTDTCSRDRLIPRRHNYKWVTCTMWSAGMCAEQEKKNCSESDWSNNSLRVREVWCLSCPSRRGWSPCLLIKRQKVDKLFIFMQAGHSTGLGFRRTQRSFIGVFILWAEY